MIVVADSSPLIALATCDSLELLVKIFDQVYVTPEVFAEVTQSSKPFAEVLSDFLQDKQHAITQKYINQNNNLDAGELSAIALYQQLNANFLLIDERAGRQFATELNITIVGSLGILVMAKQQGLIVSIKPMIDKLANSPIFFSPTLLEQVLKLVNE